MPTLITEDKTYTIDVFGGEMYVRPMTNTQSTALRKKHTKIVRGVETVDVDGLYYDRVDRVIIDWKEDDWVDGSGKPMPCTKETKRLLAERNQKYAIEALRLTDELDGDAKEAAEKN